MRAGDGAPTVSCAGLVVTGEGTCNQGLKTMHGPLLVFKDEHRGPQEPECTDLSQALRAARAHGDVLCALVEIMGTKSSLPCFVQTPVRKVVARLRMRLLMHIPDERFDAAARRIVRAARVSRGSTRYDKFQRMLQGYAV